MKDPDPPQEVEAAIKSLWEQYQEGRKYAIEKKAFPASASESKKVMLRKLKHLSDPESGYSLTEFKSLLADCERHQFAMGISVIRLLLSVEKAQRATIQKAVIEKRLNVKEVQQCIKDYLGGPRRVGVGRKTIDLRSPQDAISGLQLKITSFSGALDYLIRAHNEKTVDLPEPFLKQIRIAKQELKRLQEMAVKHLSNL